METLLLAVLGALCGNISAVRSIPTEQLMVLLLLQYTTD